MTTGSTTKQQEQERLWADVRAALPGARAIAWDGCHKVYLATDDQAVQEMRKYGYDQKPSELVLIDPAALDKAEATLRDWFERSCGFRFIQTWGGDGSWVKLIEQCEEAFEDDED